MTNRLEVTTGNHMICVYKDNESMITTALNFLKQGLDKMENIMIITDSLTKGEIRQKMRKSWTVNVESLELDYTISIQTTHDWYYAQGFTESGKIKAIWKALNEIGRLRGKQGLRVFTDTHDFFEKGYVDNLVDFESSLENKFDFNLVSMCGYDSNDISMLPDYQREILFAHHNPI